MAIEKDADWELDYAVMLVSNKTENFDKLDSLFTNIHILKEGCSGTQIRSYFRHLIVNRFNKAEGEEKEESEQEHSTAASLVERESQSSHVHPRKKPGCESTDLHLEASVA